MRPTPAEVIDGVRRILRDIIEPELTSEYSVARLREIRAVLAQVDWNDAGIRLARDNARLSALVSKLREWSVASQAPLGEEVRAVLDAACAPAGEGDLFDQHNERSATLARAVVAIMDPLGEWVAARTDDERAAELQRRLLAQLAGTA